MALVLSTDLENVRAKSFGNWFEFKPGQIKNMQDHIADFLCHDRRDLGLVKLPENYEDMDKESQEKTKEELCKRGRTEITKSLNKLRMNFEVHTQRDIDISGEKRSYITEAMPEHKEMYRRLALFKQYEMDFVSQNENDIRKYIEIIDGPSSSANTPATNKRSENIPQSNRPKQ